MSEADIKRALTQALSEQGVSAENIETLASQLLWRVGRVSDDSPVTVRVGFASGAALFADLPRLRSATDAEIEAAVEEGTLRVEWVGQLNAR
ncbi:MAG TPA: DUF3248 domain-containing protein [Trueperaceae bacterium]